MTQKNLGLIAAALLLAIGVINVTDPTKRGFTFNAILGTWLPLCVGACGLWVHLR